MYRSLHVFTYASTHETLRCPLCTLFKNYMHPVHPLKPICSSSTHVSSVLGRFELETAWPQLGAFIIELNHTQTKNEGEI